MDYTRIYNILISRAKSRVIEGYVEKHHIIPKCVGGTNDKDNLVILTAREHFIAHQLLVKIYPNEPKLAFAARMMCISKSGQQRYNNRFYEWLKIRYLKAKSTIPKKKYKKETKPRKPRAKETKPRNRIYIMSEEQKQKISQTMKSHNRKHSDEIKKRISESNKKTKALRKNNII